MHDTGEIWRYTGTPCNNNACPGWVLIDRYPHTKQISAIPNYSNSGQKLYKLHENGEIWYLLGEEHKCTASQCPGWTLIDKNPRTKAIYASQDVVFQIHIDGKI